MNFINRPFDSKSIQQTIIKGIKNLPKKKAIIGISGGVDSATVAALCVKALGKKNVFGVLLPYGRQPDIQDAYILIKHLGIDWTEINIKPAIDTNLNQLKINGFNTTKLDKANLLARERMKNLYFFSGKFNGLVIGTTNKTEYKIGYFTKFGDGACDIEPIIGLYKTEVWQLARFLNIPSVIIDKKPSAGLWYGQTDETEIGVSYQDLDRFLQGDVNVLTADQAKKIKASQINSEHKRHLPFGFKLP